ALTLGLFGVLRPGDVLLSVTGDPYDTLQDVICGKNIGSLRDFGVNYSPKYIPVSGNFDSVV
ncbi:MAG: methionine gamma-lyase family protein, partial [Lentisphaeria bacterium]|nr:methionine gamma-lyase family protein [Lentisphaeria bacterium]